MGNKLSELQKKDKLRKKNDANYKAVCDAMQCKYDEHMIRNIETVNKSDVNVVIGINSEEEIILWCRASRIGKCKYKFVCGEDYIKFKSNYVLYRHARCSGCDELNHHGYPCVSHYHFFGTVKLHSNNIVKYMISKGIKHKIE